MTRAWQFLLSRFAAQEGGPPLEFTRLVSEGESLSSRISSQIRWLQVDAAAKANGFSEAHLELLALAAVANETGARVSLERLCATVALNPLTGPLKALENEYMVRVQDDGNASGVKGLHLLRSKAIVRGLFAEMPELQRKYAIEVLPLIVDEDTETFLLSAFSHTPEFSDELFKHIRNIVPWSWTHTACIAKALIWEGVSRYEQKNREAILAAMAKYQSGWWLVCDSFVNDDPGRSVEVELFGKFPIHCWDDFVVKELRIVRISRISAKAD